MAFADQNRSANASPFTPLDGQNSFVEFCAPCHGTNGKGKGPAAVALRTRPTDLTTIAKRKGAFRSAEVEAAIRGNDALISAHGTAEMPVWGHYFTAVDGNESAQVRIANLVKYLESIQVK